MISIMHKPPIFHPLPQNPGSAPNFSYHNFYLHIFQW